MFLLESNETFVQNSFILIARFIAASIIGYGIFVLVVTHIENWYRLFVVKYFYKNHTIIIGLGEIGRRMANELTKQNERIVVIEKNPQNESINVVKRNGGKVITGNALEKETITLAGFNKAKRFLILTGEDERNIHIANLMSGLYREKGYTHPVKGLVHIERWDNNQVLKDYLELFHDTATFDINTFNLYQETARIIYDLYPPNVTTEMNGESSQPLSIAIVGYNNTAEAFMTENMILSHYPHKENIKVYLVHQDVEEIVKSIYFKFPFIDRFIRLIPIKQTDSLFYDENSTGHIEQCLLETVIYYVFGDDDAAVMNNSKYIKQLLFSRSKQLHDIPVIACLHEQTEIIGLLNVKHSERAGENIFSALQNNFNIRFVRLFSDSCTKKRLIDQNEKADILAKIVNYYYTVKYEFYHILESYIHESGRQTLQKCISDVENTFVAYEFKTSNFLRELESFVFRFIVNYPGIKDQLTNSQRIMLKKKLGILSCWYPLSDHKKDSNRYVVRHLPVKTKVRTFFSKQSADESKQILSALEHKRWMAEKYVFGFRYGEFTNDKSLNKKLKDQLKVHNLLVDFEELDESEKNKDDDMFRLIPMLMQVQENLMK